MIDNFAIFLFSLLVVYTVYRAIELDKVRPWFSDGTEQQAPPGAESKKKRP